MRASPIPVPSREVAVRRVVGVISVLAAGVLAVPLEAQWNPGLDLGLTVGSRRAEQRDPITGEDQWKQIRGGRADLRLHRVTGVTVGLAVQYERYAAAYLGTFEERTSGPQTLLLLREDPSAPKARFSTTVSTLTVGPSLQRRVLAWLSLDARLRTGRITRENRSGVVIAGRMVERTGRSTWLLEADVGTTVHWNALRAGVSYQRGRSFYRDGGMWSTGAHRLAFHAGLHVPLRQIETPE